MQHDLENANASEGLAQYCTFILGDVHLGIEVTAVQEVVRHQEITEVPLAPECVAGLINLRGEIVTVLDIRPQLGLPTEDRLAMNVVIRSGEEAISVLVNSASHVVTPSPDDFEPLPESVPDNFRNLLIGAFKLQDRLLLVLNTSKITEPSAMTQSQKQLQ